MCFYTFFTCVVHVFFDVFYIEKCFILKKIALPNECNLSTKTAAASSLNLSLVKQKKNKHTKKKRIDLGRSVHIWVDIFVSLKINCFGGLKSRGDGKCLRKSKNIDENR